MVVSTTALLFSPFSPFPSISSPAIKNRKQLDRRKFTKGKGFEEDSKTFPIPWKSHSKKWNPTNISLKISNPTWKFSSFPFSQQDLASNYTKRKGKGWIHTQQLDDSPQNYIFGGLFQCEKALKPTSWFAWWLNTQKISFFLPRNYLQGKGIFLLSHERRKGQRNKAPDIFRSWISVKPLKKLSGKQTQLNCRFWILICECCCYFLQRVDH